MRKISIIFLLVVASFISCKKQVIFVGDVVKYMPDSIMNYFLKSNKDLFTKDTISENLFVTKNTDENWIQYNLYKYDREYHEYIKFLFINSDEKDKQILLSLYSSENNKSGYSNFEIQVFTRTKTDTVWKNSTNDYIPKEFIDNNYRECTVDYVDNKIVIDNWSYNNKVYLIWNENKFILENKLPENFGIARDFYAESVTPEIEKIFQEFWTKFKIAIENNDTLALYEMTLFPLERQENFNGFGEVVEIELEEVKKNFYAYYPNFQLLSTYPDNFQLSYDFYKNYNETDNKYSEDQITYQYNIDYHYDSSFWFFAIFDGEVKFYLKIDETFGD